MALTVNGKLPLDPWSTVVENCFCCCSDKSISLRSMPKFVSLASEETSSVEGIGWNLTSQEAEKSYCD